MEWSERERGRKRESERERAGGVVSLFVSLLFLTRPIHFCLILSKHLPVVDAPKKGKPDAPVLDDIPGEQAVET